MKQGATTLIRHAPTIPAARERAQEFRQIARQLREFPWNGDAGIVQGLNDLASRYESFADRLEQPEPQRRKGFFR